MSGLLAVYQKEMSTYFRSPIAYYVVAVFLLGTGYFFLYNIFLSGETTMAGTFQNMGILLVTLALANRHGVRQGGERPCDASGEGKCQKRGKAGEKHRDRDRRQQ